MTPTDALFWYAESALPAFRPIIGGLYVLAGTPEPEAMRAAMAGVVQAVPRLRQRVVEAPFHLATPEWIDDRHFDLDYHLRHLSVPPPGGMRDLLDLAAAVFATPLDRERPLWEAYWIEGMDGGRTAFFLKLHHSVVDGVGSIAILDGLTRPPDSVRPLDHASVQTESTVSQLARLARDGARDAVRTAVGCARLPMSIVRQPLESIARAAAMARGLAGVVNDVRKPAIVDPLARPCSGLSRRLDVSSVTLQRLRDIKSPWDVTINDIVLTALTTCLAAYHRERRVVVDRLNCLVPISLRASNEHDALGNRVGLCNVVLPLGERNLERRLQRIVAQTRSVKHDRRGALYPILTQALTFIPGVVFGWMARQSLGRVNVACTNVPGIPDARMLAGVEIEAIYPFASVVQGTPLIVALLSYAGRMHIGIDSDPEAIPDPHRITELFESALDELEEAGRRTLQRQAAAR